MTKKCLLKQEKKQVDKQQNCGFNSLGSLISEFQFSDDKNPFEIFLEQLFVQKRKLAKQIIVPEKKDKTSISKFDIIINV